MKTNEIITQDFVSIFYEENRYSKKYSRCYHDWWNKKMLSFVSLKGRILDNGCGTGILFETISEKTKSIIGIDISYKMLDYAKQRTSNLILGDSQYLPFQDGSFDLVIGRSLLHHIPDPYLGLKEMARVLKRNGEIVIVDTNKSILSILPRYLANKGEHFSDDHKNMHINHLKKIISDYFNIEKVYYFGYLAYPIGFPDIFDIGKYIPYPTVFTKFLIKLDSVISNIPIIRTQSWGIMIKGTKI
jgi:ubiquinone/menaquinone biosynthesis C-methylase UbiE